MLNSILIFRRTLRRFGTLSSLDQDDDMLDSATEEENRDIESPPESGTLRSWAGRASSFVVSKMILLEQLGKKKSLKINIKIIKTEYF